MERKKRFSRAHPVKIKDTDVFLHGTSSKRYLAIQSTGFLLRKVDGKNFGISQNGICFEKYDEHGEYCGGSAADFTESTVRFFCEIACKNDKSSEGVILQIKGRELKKLGCKIFVDWNRNFPKRYDPEGIPIDVDSNAPVLPIIILDKDIPLEYLEVFKRISI